MEQRGEFYWQDSRFFVRVTSVLDNVLAKPQLQYWFGQQVYRATVADPTISEKEALSAPYKISDKAKARGSAVHSIVEVFKAGTDFETFMATVAEEHRGYAQAFWRWVNDYHPDISAHERSVFSPKYGYAGTLDMLATVNGSLGIVDCKTSKDIYPNFWLQLSAYRQALKEEGTEVEWTAILLLQEDGGYKYEVSTQDLFRQFFACKVLWDWQNAEKIEQMTKYAKNGGNGNGKTVIQRAGS